MMKGGGEVQASRGATEKPETKKRKIDAAELNMEYIEYSGKAHEVLNMLKRVISELQDQLDIASSKTINFADA